MENFNFESIGGGRWRLARPLGDSQIGFHTRKEEEDDECIEKVGEKREKRREKRIFDSSLKWLAMHDCATILHRSKLLGN